MGTALFLAAKVHTLDFARNLPGNGVGTKAAVRAEYPVGVLPPQRRPFCVTLCHPGKSIHVFGGGQTIVGGLTGVLGWLLRFARLVLVPKSE